MALYEVIGLDRDTDEKRCSIIEADNQDDAARKADFAVSNVLMIPGEGKYRIQCANSSQELAEHINTLMQDGWRPAGGVHVGNVNEQLRFFQAVTKDGPLAVTVNK